MPPRRPTYAVEFIVTKTVWVPIEAPNERRAMRVAQTLQSEQVESFGATSSDLAIGKVLENDTVSFTKGKKPINEVTPGRISFGIDGF